MTRGARRAVIVLFVITFALAAGNWAFTWTQVRVLHGQQQSACAFARDLGSAPLPASPRPSKLGVSIVADSRAWWRRNDCTGSLPPSPGLDRWIAYYRLPVRP